jgi:hypothetical protein
MSSDTRVATIAAVAAIVGTVVGGVVTYVGNQAIFGQQLSREERQQKIAGRGVARVYAEQVNSAEKVLKYDYANHRWPGRNQLGFFELPALEDRRLIQSRLSLRAATAVSEADEAMRAVTSIVDIEPERGLSERGTTQIVTYIGTLHRGQYALGAYGK